MRRVKVITLAGIIAVIAVSTLGSLASVNLGFNYAWFIPLSMAIYGTVGFFVSKFSGLPYSPLAGGIVGFVDSTAGWYFSWTIGAGDFPVEIDGILIAVSVAFVVLLATLTATLGGAVARVFRGRKRMPR